MNVAVNNTWPDLPLPLIDYSGMPQGSGLVSDSTYGKQYRRNRHRIPYQQLFLKWVFDPFQYPAFQSFYIDDLGNGTATFALELRYPKNSSLTTWQVRFLGDINKTYNDGKWTVTGVVCLLQPVIIVEPRDPTVTEAESGEEVVGEEDQIGLELGFGCSEGFQSSVSSNYVWSLPSGVDPNEGIIAEYREHAKILFANEREAMLDGVAVLNSSNVFWDFVSTPITNKSGFNKAASGNTDPNDPEGDHTITISSGYWVLTMYYCFS